MKITFFEQLQSGLTAQQSGSKVLSALVERPELTGEYIIQQDGRVFLALLGPVQAAGETAPGLEQALVAGFQCKINGQVRISIQLLEREPIYVTGQVAKRGSFKYVPGMSVLHALVLSAGVDGPNAEYWRLFDAAKERERLLKSQEKLKKLLARVDVLKSEREGSALTASSELAKIAGTSGSTELVMAEQHFRALELIQRATKGAALDATVAALHNELTIQRGKMLQIESGVKEKAERVQELVALRSRGNTTDINFHTARTELNEARERWHEVRANIARTEGLISQAEQERTRLGIDATFDREREIKDALQGIAEEQATRATIASLLLALPASSGTTSGLDQKPTYWIDRRTPLGLQRLPASEQSALQPGDILEVTPSGTDTRARPEIIQN